MRVRFPHRTPLPKENDQVKLRPVHRTTCHDPEEADKIGEISRANGGPNEVPGGFQIEGVLIDGK